MYRSLIRLYHYTGAGQNNGNSIQHRNETVCVECTERTWVLCILRYSFVCLRCGVPVSMQYRWCLVTVRMEVSQNRSQIIFSKRAYCWCEFSWSICNQNGHLLGVSRAAVSKVMTAYTNHAKTSSAKRNNGRKTKMSARDGGRLCLKIIELLQQRWQQNSIFLSTRFLQKHSDGNFHKFHIHGRAAVFTSDYWKQR